ncbi:hypothetical protein [Achromobacter xylosoxidans]|uniref:hypothetical protein n=1 Tax=Alcaligenes xylosoxydans xylosoxydans TaxID=85698 RepID=UPI00192A7F9E|nr:hypothetical protein [Achromobacter xylosoxidans]
MLMRGDSGRPVRAVRAPAAGKGATLSRVAAMMCGSAKFQRWVVSRIGAAPQGVSPSQHAAQFVRDACGITSRAQLDHSATAATLFHEAVRKPFIEWSGLYA